LELQEPLALQALLESRRPSTIAGATVLLLKSAMYFVVVRVDRLLSK
jgi:hypothetical protein